MKTSSCPYRIAVLESCPLPQLGDIFPEGIPVVSSDPLLFVGDTDAYAVDLNVLGHEERQALAKVFLEAPTPLLNLAAQKGIVAIPLSWRDFEADQLFKAARWIRGRGRADVDRFALYMGFSVRRTDSQKAQLDSLLQKLVDKGLIHLEEAWGGNHKLYRYAVWHDHQKATPPTSWSDRPCKVYRLPQGQLSRIHSIPFGQLREGA